MDAQAAMYEISKVLLDEDDDRRTPEQLLRRVLEQTGATCGFIVIREADAYALRFSVDYEGDALPNEDRRFSRTLVRQVIESKEIVCSTNLALDPRFAMAKSVSPLDVKGVVAAPLHHGGEVFGVIYLELPVGHLDESLNFFLSELAQTCGLFLRRAAEREALRERGRQLERGLFAQYDFAGIVTRHPTMIEMLRVLAQVAASRASVLVGGESGTGKELVARALHLNSDRRARPYVALHCSALPATVLESELFGHVRGAFTGAHADRKGRIASADGGTLFLDEVAEIPLEVQAKLLRFTQFGEIQRLGSDDAHKVDVRLIAATHQDLPALIAAGRFRQDLYFRLKVIELRIPPLRERAGDLPLLIEHFLSAHWRRPGEIPRVTKAAAFALAAYPFPGNVRELAHAIERACLLARGPELDESLLPPEILAAVAHASPAAAPVTTFDALTGEGLQRAREAAVEDVERRFLESLMEHAGGNVSKAAREASMPRSYLQRLLARHRGAPEGD